MDRNEAQSALDAVRDADRRMAKRMTWPFQRHALFGVGEGLIVMAMGLTGFDRVGAAGAGVALLLSLMYQDKQRYGMFVSGWRGKATKPLTVAMTVLALAAMALNYFVFRWEDGTNPAVVITAIVTAAILTWGSIRWQTIYQRELRDGDLA